jgi:hypothetical protein
MKTGPGTPHELRNLLMTFAAVSTPRPWKRRVAAVGDTTPYNQRLNVQDPKTGNFTAEDAEFIQAAADHLEGLVKENLRREIDNKRLAAIIWKFMEYKPSAETTLSADEERLYEEAENAMMDMGFYSKEMAESE